MPIYKGSRYEYSLIDYILTDKYNVPTPIVFYDIPPIGTITYTEHQYVVGERLDQLSMRYYNTPKAWWLIVQANPEVVDFLHIPIGTILRIPNA